MKKIKLITTHKKLLADTVTPVSIYLKLRDKFENPILLESSDYHGNDNSFSYICCEPLASFEVKDGVFKQSLPGSETETGNLAGKEVEQRLSAFAGAFEADTTEFKFINNGLFGYIGYDGVQYFENIPVSESKEDQYGIPDVLYNVYRFVIAVDHFKNELYIFEHAPEGSERKGLEAIENLVNNKNYPSYEFTTTEEEASNYTDEQFLDRVRAIGANYVLVCDNGRTAGLENGWIKQSLVEGAPLSGLTPIALSETPLRIFRVD